MSPPETIGTAPYFSANFIKTFITCPGSQRLLHTPLAYASPHFYLSENSPTPTSLRFLTTWIVGPLTGAHLSFYLLKIH